MTNATELLIDRAASPGSRKDGTGSDPSVASRPSAADVAEPADPGFLDRQSELELIHDGLKNPIGPYFWLVVAPPGLGKTTFLNFLARRLRTEERDWDIRPVDLRDRADSFVDEPAWLLARFFAAELGGDVESDIPERIANAVLADGRSRICLLDSAELLSERSVAELRRYFGEIHQRTGALTGTRAGRRVALVVASRLESGWRGLVPAPRFWELPLVALTSDDVMQVVRRLVIDAGEDVDPGEQDRLIASLAKSSGGVPELLASCLSELQRSAWRLDPARNERLFQEIGDRFVRDRLLSADSLLPVPSADPAGRRRQLVEDALRLLAPYRRFTRSHLRHHLAAGGKLAAASTSVGWSLEDLWNAIADSALVYRPLDEFWQALQPAIRDLLFRSFYPAKELRIRAQEDALAFDRRWSAEQAGAVQVAGLVECLWHEASTLGHVSPDERDTKLADSAWVLAKTLRPSGRYSVDDLRQMFAVSVDSDDDLCELTSRTIGSLGKIINAVRAQ
jgi:hypothetical protein